MKTAVPRWCCSFHGSPSTFELEQPHNGVRKMEELARTENTY